MAKKKTASASKKKTKSTAAPVPVDAIKHKDSRTNIPTRELAAFAGDDERAPKSICYPRDPSLDPQLVWKGKDEQDQKALEVPAVPIYIQEKIHPQALLEDIRTRAAAGKERQLDLFADFNGIDEFDKKVDFYHHDQHWTNRMILGDSLLVMTSLAEKERLKGRVQMIYLDPPYGIKFGSNWQVSTRKREVKDAKAEDVTRQPEQIKAFRDTWQMGIHSYLTYLRDRLTVARDLLTESGSIFVQIGDENVHLVRCVMDEVFGCENFLSLISFATTSGFDANALARGGDYILWYARTKESAKYRELFQPAQRELGVAGYRWIVLSDGTTRGLTTREIRGEDRLPDGAKLYKPDNIISQGASSDDQTFRYLEKKYSPGLNAHWKASFPDGMNRLGWAGRLHVARNTLQYVRFDEDFPWRSRNNIWTDTLTGQFTEEKTYVVQTNTKVIERCLLMTTDPGDLVLDPTCGSGTTAYVAEQWGRRWITIDTSRVALALARTRLMAAKFPYYLLADSPEGRNKLGEPAASAAGWAAASSHPAANAAGSPTKARQPAADSHPAANAAGSPTKARQPAADSHPAANAAGSPTPASVGLPPCQHDIRRGFVYKCVPHITLKSIANNPDIREGMSRQEIDAAIRKHAETETLYDQPYEDKNVVRVSGPFTVESLSPHRMLPGEPHPAASHPAEVSHPAANAAGSPRVARRATSIGEPAALAAGWGEPAGCGVQAFVQTILDNLRKAGVQNTVKNERLTFDHLDSFPGEYIQAEGTFTENGTSKAVRVCIGPEFGTVGPEWVQQAALEAMRGSQCDLLLVCGFSFDPHVVGQTEELKKEMRFGKLRILPVRMNPDLAMGDELLKKTGSGNLFLVFGEPDIALHKQKDGRLIVELRGVDVYDPTSGEVRSHSTDDIACWFLDTDYNGESFFVRHAYFCGADTPYEKLQRALRAEIDEAEWSKLYATRSLPFAAPKKGKIAVKVINHYGDEVLKVFRNPPPGS